MIDDESTEGRTHVWTDSHGLLHYTPALDPDVARVVNGGRLLASSIIAGLAEEARLTAEVGPRHHPDACDHHRALRGVRLLDDLEGRPGRVAWRARRRTYLVETVEHVAGQYETVWRCPPPRWRERFVVVRQEWDDEFRRRIVDEVRVVPEAQ